MTQFAQRIFGGPAQFTPSSSPYGTTIQSQGSVLNPARVVDMQNMGIWWCRFFVNWTTMEPTYGGAYDFSLWDDAIAKCNAVGINFVATIQGPPAWHCYGWPGPTPPATPPNPCDPSKTWAIPADAAAFATVIATRYNGSTTPNPLKAGTFLFAASVESANEGFDDGISKCHSGKWAVPVQKAVYNAVKAVNPAILVGAPAQLQLDDAASLAWIQAYYAAGGGGYADYHQIHFYPGSRGPNTDDGSHVTMFNYANQIVTAASGYGHGKVGVWMTETGYAQNNLTGTDSGPCAGAGGGVGSYAEQSCLLQETLDAGRLSNGIIDKVFIYTLSSGDGYSPIHGQTPEVFEAGYTMYVAYTAQYPVWTGGTSPPSLSIDQSSLGFGGISGSTPPPPQTINLSDPATVGTDWTSTIVYSTLPAYIPRAFSGTLESPPQGANWLTLTPESGTLAAGGSVPIVVTASIGVLPAGIYTAVITFTAVSGGATVTVSVNLNVIAPQLPQTNTYNVLVSLQPVQVVASTLSVKTSIGRRGEALMTIYDPAGATHFQQYQQMSIFDNFGNLAFSGYLTQPQESKIGFQPLLETAITATDQHYLADKRLVAAIYTNKTPGFIVKDLIVSILAQEGVSAGLIIDPGVIIPSATFVFCTVADALDALVVQASSSEPYYWMIDQYKQLIFAPYSAVTGPVIDGTLVDDGTASGFVPVVTRANPLYRNVQYGAGGVVQTDLITETSWTMGYPLASAPTITLDGVDQSVDIKGASGSAFYWAQGDATIAQQSGNTVPLSTDTLVFTYIGQYPQVFTTQNSAQIAAQAALDGTSGKNESAFIDNTITSIAQGLSEVGLQLTRYGTQGLLFEFNTRQSGISASQWVTVNYGPLGFFNVQMLVEEVNASDQQDGYNLWYDVKCIQGPYDTNWVSFFKNILAPQQVANSINIGIAGGSIIPTNFVYGLTVSMTLTVTTGGALFPSDTLFPSDSLFPD